MDTVDTILMLSMLRFLEIQTYPKGPFVDMSGYGWMA